MVVVLALLCFGSVAWSEPLDEKLPAHEDSGPLTLLVQTLQLMAFGQLSACGCMCVSVSVHLFSTLVLLECARITLPVIDTRYGFSSLDARMRHASGVAAVLVWTVHPLRVECVAWSAGQSFILAGACASAMLAAYVRARVAPSVNVSFGWALLASCSYVAAVLCETAALPLLALLAALEFAVFPGATGQPALMRRSWRWPSGPAASVLPPDPILFGTYLPSLLFAMAMIGWNLGAVRTSPPPHGGLAQDALVGCSRWHVSRTAADLGLYARRLLLPATLNPRILPSTASGSYARFAERIPASSAAGSSPASGFYAYDPHGSDTDTHGSDPLFDGIFDPDEARQAAASSARVQSAVCLLSAAGVLCCSAFYFGRWAHRRIRGALPTKTPPPVRLLASNQRPASAGVEPEGRLSWHRTGGPPQLASNRRAASAGAEPEARLSWSRGLRSALAAVHCCAHPIHISHDPVCTSPVHCCVRLIHISLDAADRHRIALPIPNRRSAPPFYACSFY